MWSESPTAPSTLDAPKKYWWLEDFVVCLAGSLPAKTSSTWMLPLVPLIFPLKHLPRGCVEFNVPPLFPPKHLPRGSLPAILLVRHHSVITISVADPSTIDCRLPPLRKFITARYPLPLAYHTIIHRCRRSIFSFHPTRPALSMSLKRLSFTTLMATFAIMTMTSTRAFQQQILRPVSTSRRAALWTHPSDYDGIHMSALTSSSIYLGSRSVGASRIGASKRSSHYRHSSRTTRLLSQTSSSSTTDTLSDESTAISLENKIKTKGDEIRSLKEKGISKEELAPHLAELMELKSQLNPSQQQQPQSTKKETQTSTNNANIEENAESDFITPRSTNYSKWYNDIVRICDLAETSPVRGCMVIKPWGMSLWDQIRTNLDARIKEHGAENAYFPLLIPQSFLSKEAEHVDGFAKECAVVTHHRLTTDTSSEKGGLMADPEAELEDPLIIRPTSETMIWSMFKKWIVSHR